MKKIPYGNTNFADIIRNNKYYVDKTAYIQKVEDSHDFFFFIRPRRFGKTLFMEMLKTYYDLNLKDKWQELFGSLYVGSHPTPQRNSYLIIGLDFSVIDGGLGNYRESMDDHCRIKFLDFADRYKHLLPEDFKENLKQIKGAIVQLQYICTECAKHDLPVYLFIDEYDHFTNDILSDVNKLDVYEGETHGEGYLRKFFNALKEGSKTSLKKLFITGVSPVTMDDVTSGFNIGTNYTSDSDFNGMMGFNENEVREMLAYYEKATGVFHHSIDELITLIKPWYDNYCFAKECLNDPPMYNSDMVLYFVSNYAKRGMIPNELIDTNVRTDYARLRMLVRKDVGSVSEANVCRIQQIARDGYVVADINSHFPARDIVKHQNFTSLLYYFGLLTIGGVDEFGRQVLTIPNQCIREQTYEYLLGCYEGYGMTEDECRRDELLLQMAFKGNFKELFCFEEEILKRFTSHRELQWGEALVQTFVKAQTCLNPYWLTLSEEDLSIYAGYSDLYFQPRLERMPHARFSYIIEFKYLKSDATDTEVRTKVREAIGQANRYAKSDRVLSTLGDTTLKKLVVLFCGTDLAVCEEVDKIIN